MAMNIRPIAHAAACLMLAGASAHAAAPGTVNYELDPARSSLKFIFTQAGAENQGRFRDLTVALRFDDKNLAASRLDVVVKTGSLNTGDDERDTALRTADLLDVAKFPEARFQSARINRTGAGRYEAVGKLTLRGVTRSLTVPFALRLADEKAGAAGYMTGRAPFNRLDFGVGQGDWKSTEQVANEVSVNFTLRLKAVAAKP